MDVAEHVCLCAHKFMYGEGGMVFVCGCRFAELCAHKFRVFCVY